MVEAKKGLKEAVDFVHEQKDSVEITQDAKGNYKFIVKAYFNPDQEKETLLRVKRIMKSLNKDFSNM